LFIDDVVEDSICGDNTMFELPVVAAVAVAVAVAVAAAVVVVVVVVVVERNSGFKRMEQQIPIKRIPNILRFVGYVLGSFGVAISDICELLLV
jgi:hypothetical protein